jgi:hypothetical protein
MYVDIYIYMCVCVCVRFKFQLDVHGFICILFSSIYFFSTYFGCYCICTHPQEHKLQSTALGVFNRCGMLVHWTRYWLGHPHTFGTVKFGLDRAKLCVYIYTYVHICIHRYIGTYVCTFVCPRNR